VPAKRHAEILTNYSLVACSRILWSKNFKMNTVRQTSWLRFKGYYTKVVMKSHKTVNAKVCLSFAKVSKKSLKRNYKNKNSIKGKAKLKMTIILYSRKG
jgi:hypothetical protein